MSNVLRLRTASDPRFNTLHREFEWGELDQNFVSLMNLIETAGTDSFPSILSFDPTFQYRPGEMPFFVSFNNNIYENVAITPHTGITPGTSESTWRHVSVGRLSHEQNTDFMLGRHSAYIGYSANIDLRIPLLRDKNDFIISNTSGPGEYTVNLITSASGNDAAVEHIFQVRIAPNQNYNIRFSSTLDMYVGSEDAVLTPGHIAYFLGSAISPGGTMRTHLLFITDRVGGIPEAPNDAEVYSRGALAWVRGVAKTVYDAFVEYVMSQISGLGSSIAGHEAATTAHSATAAATASRIILRDAAGRAQVAAPVAAADIARLDTVTGHAGDTVIHITSGERTAWNAKAENLIQFGRIITTATTIAAADLYKEVVVNSPANINLTIGVNIPIGGWVNFRIDGAGIPVFAAGVNQTINTHSITDRQFCQIYRGENAGTTEKYFVI